MMALALAWTPAAPAQERHTEDASKLTQIRSFGFVRAHVEGTDGTGSNDIGLSNAEMTKYLRARFAEHFGKVEYAERSVAQSEDDRVGQLWCRVWTVGTAFPVAYFVECRLGSFRAPNLLEQSSLGYDKRESIEETVKKSLDNTLAGLAKGFLQNRSGKPRLYVPRQ
jgi:hypothetical protein